MMEKTMELLAEAAKNWDTIVVGLVTAIALAEKLGIVIISTIKNLRDAYSKAFPKASKWSLPKT